MESKLQKILGEEVSGKEGKVAVSSLEGKEVIGLYFSAHWCGPCRQFTPKLGEAYTELLSKDKKFEVVFVSFDRSKEAFEEYYGSMPSWLAIPFEDRKRAAKLSARYKIQGYPTLILIDGNGKIVSKKGRSDVANVDRFPWKSPSLSEALGERFLSHQASSSSGDGDGDGGVDVDAEKVANLTAMGFKEDLVRAALIVSSNDQEAALECLVSGSVDGVSLPGKKPGKVGKEALEGKYVGLYFSASWCPPCRNFTPKLVQCFEKLKEKRDDVEIIFVSADQDESKFLEYYQKMPKFLAIPFSDEAKSTLPSILDVPGYPTLIFVDPERNVVCWKGVASVMNDPEGAEFPWPPKPVDSLSSSPDGLNESPCVVVLAESESKDVQENYKQILYTVSEEERAKAEAEGEDPEILFYIGDEDGGIAKNLRSLMSFGPSKSEKSREVVCDEDSCKIIKSGGEADTKVVLIDVPDNGGFYVFEGDLSVEKLKEFLGSYRDGALKRSQMVKG